MKPALVFAWVVFVVSVVALVAQIGGWGLTVLFGEGALLTIGTLLVLRRPGNTIGTILVVMGTVWALILAADATVATLAERGNDTVVSWLALVFMIVTIPLLWLGNIVIWLVFPDGQPSTTGARRFLRISAAYTVALTVAHVFARPRILAPGEAEYPHPFLDQTVADGVGVAMDVLITVLLFLGGFLAAGMLFARSRHSDPIERRQIGWVALGYVISNVILLVNAFVQPLGSAEETQAGLALDSIAFLVIAVTLGVAITRYRLYDIDVIISKSVTYLGLAAVIAAVFAAVVAIPTLVVGESDKGSPGLLLPIVATAIVAILFEPIRSRMQRWANRLVYGERSTPHEVLSQLTARLSETGQRSGIDDLARLLAEGTGAENAAVWLQAGDTLVREAAWPVDEAEVHPIAVADLIDDECRVATPIRHGEEMLGALSVTKPRNDPLTPADRELVADVAGGAGLMLRNIGLNRQLEERAQQVRESRRRLIEAQDAERHRLERDLHDGAQQQVVALKVKLGLAKTIADRAGADDVATLVSGLADNTQHAVDALRTVAHGIYPPLLESEGLEAALRAVERSSPLPIDLEVADLHRYSRSDEETIYFCVTETLERARMSGATSARIGVTGRNGELVTEIDLGRIETELDLLAVADRLDAAGGTLGVVDQPDRGRHIVSSLPLADVGVETA